MEDKKIIDALSIISSFCCEKTCHTCFLCKTGFCIEEFRTMPSCWDIPEEEEINEKD